MNVHRTLLAATLLFPALAGCSAEPAEVTVEVVVGLEGDTLSKDPAVTRLEILARSAGGGQWKAQAAPGGTFDFGEVPADSRLSLEVTGFTAQGVPVVRGRSLVVPLESLASNVIPVFAERVNEWARPPGAMARAHAGAPAGVLAERYLVTTGGSSAAGADGSADPALGDFYDLLAYGGATSPALPVTARSLVARTSAMLLISDEAATWADFAASTLGDVALPAGLSSFAEVAGAAEIRAPEGVSYLVGATRPSGATKAVLAIAADGTVSWLQLLEARQGAAAAWIDGKGLLVAGGSPTGPGAEVLSPGATGFAPRAFPSDPTEGAAAVAIAAGQVTLVGGQVAGAAAPTRTLDPECVTACTATEMPATSLPQAMGEVRAFSLGGGKAIAIGYEIADPGLMRTFLVDIGSGSVTELPLREPRRDGSVVPAPNGTLAIVGGMHLDGSPALHIEMLFPAP